MGYDLEGLVWKCQDCEASAPATAYDYMELLKHAKGHHIHLVDTKTDTILATNIRQARKEGIDIPKGGKAVDKLAGETGVAPEPTGTGFGMELTEEGIIFPVTLPPVAFTLFDAAKAAGFVDEDEDIDAWLFECIQKRFELDYKLRLMLIPIIEKEEEKKKEKEEEKENKVEGKKQP